MSNFKSIIFADLYRYNKMHTWAQLFLTVLRKQEFRYVFVFRLYQAKVFRFLSWIWLKFITNRTQIFIGWKTKIDSGLVIIHGGCIAVNNEAVIGKNCTIYHGVTIGMEFRGKRRGNPVIGNQVWVGANAAIVGNVRVGDDVLIAPGAFVNFDVPSHSVVIGNPGKIIQKENATLGYVTNIN